MPTLRRRDFLCRGLALAACGILSGCALPPAPWQTKPKVPRIGYLGIGVAMPNSGSVRNIADFRTTASRSFLVGPLGGEFQQSPAHYPNSLLLDAFRQGLRDLGYVEGENVEIEYRFLDGKLEQAPAFAAELVELKVDIIVTAGIEATIAASKATTSIPIVGAILGADPVADGLVASLARPGGNLTGLVATPGSASGKQLQILKEVVPTATRVAVLWNANNPVKVREITNGHDVAATLGLTLLSAEVRREADFVGAFQAIVASQPDALWVLQEPVMAAQSARIAAFAIERRLPAMYETRLYVDVGGLMSYGVQSVERYYRAATYVDKILKGAKPADLPVEQPTAFDFVINLKTARAVGLTIPPSVLQQATEILQ